MILDDIEDYLNPEEYYHWAKQLVDVSKPEDLLQTVEKIVRENDEWRTRKCINLNAAESVLSPRANRLLQSDLERRAVLGELEMRHHKGARYVDKLDAIVTEQAKKLFRVAFAEHRPITTSLANALALRALTDPGDTILALEAPRGHPSWREQGYAGFRGLNIVDIPFDYSKWNIDVPRLRQVTENLKKKPKVFVVGTSVFLFPHPLKEIAGIASGVGARVWYDAAHVLGLIAGGMF
jgi:glycine hydroxymethyltransferase